jgi:hypothetical protein
MPADLVATETPEPDGLNPNAVIPFGVTPGHIYKAMKDFTDFLGFIDTQLLSKDMARFEDMLMLANFSSVVSEFIAATIPKYCKTVARNRYHNGHPDILPAGKHPNDAVKHAGNDGIEVKASRRLSGWQGHNAEDVWLMVFVFQSGRFNPKLAKQVGFKFLFVAGALLTKDDWRFSGRSAKSRRTITASVTKAGFERMMANWIYKCSELRTEGQLDLVAGDANP